MNCSLCDEKAVFKDPALCKNHFINYVDDKVKETVEEYSLCSKDDKVLVAVSGGKDSAVLLVTLKKLGYNVEGLAVDEGIKGYRDSSLDDLRKLCADYNVPLHIVSFKDEVGKDLDELVEGRYPCSVCGVFRRYLLNKHAKGYDVIATGHNLDDEAQAVLMNLIKANKQLLLRTHVRSPPAKGFVPRIKPLMFLLEKEILAYAVLLGLQIDFGECPYVTQSLRAQVRDVLNEYELSDRGMKLSLVKAGLSFAITTNSSVFSPCPTCSEPSVGGGVCRACTLKEELKTN